MAHVLHYVLEYIFPAETPYQMLVFQCLDSMVRWYRELPRSREEPVDGEFMAVRLGRLARQHVTLYMELSRHPGRPKSFIAFKPYPKHHIFIHLAEEDYIVHGNPRENWNYEDEDMIGTCVESVSNCSQNSRFIH
eukprot:4729717-Pyramimonas_sp.AAC.1